MIAMVCNQFYIYSITKFLFRYISVGNALPDESVMMELVENRKSSEFGSIFE